MRVLLRTDASIAIGSGHVRRCLALATALRGDGAEVIFASREGPGSLSQELVTSGFELAPLRGENCSSAADLEATQRAVGGRTFDWVVVDHYQLDWEWERGARALGSRLLAIDDTAQRRHECDMLLDQNYSHAEERYAGLAPASCERLLGPKFALLRPEFRPARERLRERDGQVRRVLVYFGNADTPGATLRAVEALATLDLAEVSAEIVLGDANPHAARIRACCDGHPAFRVRSGDIDMAAAMSQADLSIGAGGVTTWERCCLGLPSILIALADNQVPGSEALGRDGYVVFLGRAPDVSADLLADALRDLMADRARLTELSRRAASLVDGLGARRVVNRMRIEGLALRKARASDCERVLAWRNGPEVRRRAKDSRAIGEREHREWYAQKLADPDCVLLIAELPGTPVGVLRYDLHQDEARVSIFLAPGLEGRGLGPRMLVRGSEWLRKHHPRTKRLLAEILEDNDRSAHAFACAGYVRERDLYCKVL